MNVPGRPWEEHNAVMQFESLGAERRGGALCAESSQRLQSDHRTQRRGIIDAHCANSVRWSRSFWSTVCYALTGATRTPTTYNTIDKKKYLL